MVRSDSETLTDADNEESIRLKSSPVPVQVSSGGPASGAVMQSFGVARRVMSRSTRTMTCPTIF